MAGTAEQSYLDALLDEFSFHYDSNRICRYLNLEFEMSFSPTMLRMTMKRLNELACVKEKLVNGDKPT